MALLALPRELLCHVLAHISVPDLLRLGCVDKELSILTKDASMWQQIAVAKWGPLVTILRAQVETDWAAYCKRRMSLRTIKRSPYLLGQEEFPDPWQHLVCCLLCSRTTGSQTVQNGVYAFFRLFPTPSDVIAADPKLLLAFLASPFGLAASRSKALTRMSASFLAEDWDDVTTFHGVGAFTSDSFRIFCLGDLSLRNEQGRKVEDATLLRYLHWARRDGDTPAVDQDQGPPSTKNVEVRVRRQEAALLAKPKRHKRSEDLAPSVQTRGQTKSQSRRG
mmetsp:Transcript_69/g.238  ORF Transcript_69/g.238 Transcript_69/m.238 type:complete len:278 (-) Transcript_69:214-1047(-)